MKIGLIFLLAALSWSALAIPEANFFEVWRQEVIPHFNQANQRSFTNFQGLKLNYYSLVNPDNKKTLVILPGRTEPALKYAEVVYDLKDLGFNVFILDHQGQGNSDRLVKDSHKGYVKHFIDYARDLSDWMDEVVIPETQNQERYLLAHSMGGAIATLYLAYGKPVFKKALLSSPMMEIDTKPYKENIGRLLTGVLVTAGMGKAYAPDRGPYVSANDTFEKNDVTHSLVRFEASRYLFMTWPELALGGPTNRWVHQSLKATKKIDTLAEKIQIPVLMFQSEKDLIVMPGRQNSFCSKTPLCRMVKFEGAYHEILQESDVIRNRAMGELKNFFQ